MGTTQLTNTTAAPSACGCTCGPTQAAASATMAGGPGAVQGASGVQVASQALAPWQRELAGIAENAEGSGAGQRRSVIPNLSPSEPVNVAVGQTTMRMAWVQGGASGTSVTIPAPGSVGAAGVEVFRVVPYSKGAHRTDVLVPVSGRVDVAAGETARFLVRLTGQASGAATVSTGLGDVRVNVSAQAIRPLPMMSWVNATDAKRRGATQGDVEAVLQHFGVASTGTAGAGDRVGGADLNRQYFSAAYEAANRLPVADVARRIMQAERELAASNPGATLWVQVSDEQDRSAAQVNGTVQWISQLRAALARSGSNAKFFVATQAKPDNLAYASVIDGWATTQTSAGRERDESLALIRQTAQRAGRTIEIMEYPGNAYFDGGAAGGAALSVASAGLDGASAWFLFSANNLSTLESGSGEEGRGDIGGLVAIDGGKVLPTLALAEAEYGANLAGLAKHTGTNSATSQLAATVRSGSRRLDAYQQNFMLPDLGAWEREMAARLS